MRLGLRLDRDEGQRLFDALAELSAPGDAVLDLSAVQGFDGYGAAGLLRALDLAQRRELRVALRSPSAELAELLAHLELPELESRHAGTPWIAHIGEYVLPFVEGFKAQFVLVGETVYLLTLGNLRGRGVRLDRFLREFVRAGLDALPIVSLISALIGIVLALQADAQLRQFGATIYVADLVSVSITREIGPLLIGLVVAGRTGSANTAEIGSMVVSEELDSLRQMGVQPASYLFVPKVAALAFAMPCLAVIGSGLGILCGAIICASMFGLNLTTFFAEVRQALVWGDLASCVSKSVIFGFIIGSISCNQGQAVRAGATEVGRRTTASVVVSILYIIAADTTFTWIFHGS